MDQRSILLSSLVRRSSSTGKFKAISVQVDESKTREEDEEKHIVN
jgi:hypothetical protein